MFSFAAAKPNLSQNQSGQATVEAVLLGIISFLLITGLVYQFHAGFRDYVDNYFGNYLVCLLETGELPSLGSNTEGVCGQTMASFELGEEGSKLGDGGGGSGGSDSSSSPAKSADGAVSSGSATNLTYLNQRGRGGPGSGAEEEAGGGGSAADQRSEGGGSAGDDGGFSGDSPGYRILEVRNPKSSDEGEASVQRYRSKVEGPDPAAGGSTGRLVAGENENALATSKVTFDPKSLERSPDSEDTGMGWDFSDYLRYLIILALIIAILVIVGGQALQISKSRDL